MSKHDVFRIKNEESSIKTEESCIKDDEFRSDGGTTPCNGGAAGGGGGTQTAAGTAGGSNRGYDPGSPGRGPDGGDGGGFTAYCGVTDSNTGTPLPPNDPNFESRCDDLIGCEYRPQSGHPKLDASCTVQTVGGAASVGNITSEGGWGWGSGGRGHTVPCDGGGGGGGGGWKGGGGGGGSCHGTGGGGGSGYVATATCYLLLAAALWESGWPDNLLI